MMKIKSIKPFPANIGGISQLLVKVETDNGLYGWGASGITGRELAVIGALKHFTPLIIGRNPLQIGHIWQDLYRSQYFEGGRVLLAAQSAIDVALHDIKGKALGVPVYELLGGKQRDHVDCFASLRFTTKQELLEQAEQLVRCGWNVLRLAPAEFESTDTPDVFEPAESACILSEWLTDLRELVGPKVIIGLDYHTRLSGAETVMFMKRMPEGTLDFLEEPIRDESPEAYESLRKMITVPFAIGEEFASKWQFAPFIERGITQYIRLDTCNVGGITEAMKVAAMGETHYIDLMPHNPLGPINTAATIHIAAACPNFAWLEEIHTPVANPGLNDPDFYPVQPQLEGPRYKVPDTPGLGVEVNEEALTEKEFQIHEIPRLKKRDGSVTNW